MVQRQAWPSRRRVHHSTTRPQVGDAEVPQLVGARRSRMLSTSKSLLDVSEELFEFSRYLASKASRSGKLTNLVST